MRSMHRPRIAAALLAAGLAIGCTTEPTSEPSVTALAIFDEVWSTFDAEYPSFMVRNVDWNAARDTHRAPLTPASTDGELFAALSDMLLVLRDGHVALQGPADLGFVAYSDWFEAFPENFEGSSIPGYLSDSVAEVPFVNGKVTEDVAYIHFDSFAGSGFGEAFDRFLSAVAPIEGLIIDLRGNFGGSDLEAHDVAGRLTSDAFEYRMVRYRNGPDWDDFGPWLRSGIAPAGETPFLGPIAVLTNRRVFSTGESFILALRARGDVTLVGDTPRRGSANPRWVSLPRGFFVRVPQWQEADLDGVNYEGAGIAPDEAVALTAEDISAGRDPILERAVDLLSDDP